MSWIKIFALKGTSSVIARSSIRDCLKQYTTTDIRMLITPHFVMTSYSLKMADTDASFIRLLTDRSNWTKIPK